MTKLSASAFHTAEDEWLASYCAGGLSTAKRLVLNCQASINPHLSQRLNAFEAVAGALLESSKGAPLSDNFMSRVFESIETQESSALIKTEYESQDSKMSFDDWFPAPLIDLFRQMNKPLKWKNMGFGLSRIPLLNEGREKLYLLKSKPGMKMPLHSHYGEEWALVLQGGYHVADKGYVRGDLHREDETCTHRPIIDDDGEACITLVASEGGLKFSNPGLGLLKPILRI